MRITTSIQLIAITDMRTTSNISAVIPAPAAGKTLLMVYVTGTLLEGVDSTLVIETVLIVTSELVTSAVSPYASDDCDDDMSAEYIIPIGATSTITSAFKCNIDE